MRAVRRRSAAGHRPRVARVALARFQCKGFEQLAFHVDGPNFDVAPRLEVTEIDRHVPGLEVTSRDPQGIDHNVRVSEVDIDRRAGAEDADHRWRVMFAEGLEEKQRRDIAAESLGGQQEQDPLAGVGLFLPVAAWQRAKPTLVIENAKPVRVLGDGLAGELPHARDAAFASVARLCGARRGVRLTKIEVGCRGEGEKRGAGEIFRLRLG